MKKLFLSILVILPCSMFAGSLTTIQAVCMIELKTGESIEGFISYAYGGFNNFYAPNGFCIKDGDVIKSTYLFSLGSTFSIRLDLLKSFPKARMYYIENLPNENIENYQKNTYSSKENTLNMEYKSTFKFRLHDSIEIYNELPDLVLYNQKKNCTKISFNDIEYFKILTNPSEKMLKEIDLKRKLFKTNLPEYGDATEPLWYHEIMQDREKFLHLIKYFLYE